MNDYPNVPSDETFSAEVINSTLAELPEELAKGIAEKLIANHEAAKKAEVLRAEQLQIAMLAVIAHQNYQEDTPDELDDIYLDRATRDQSIEVLYGYGLLPDESRAAIPPSVIDFASCFYVQREVQFGADDEEMERFLLPAGITLPMMYERLVELVFERGKMPKGKTIDDLRAAAPNLDIISTNSHLTYILPQLASKMREDLIAQGYQLPELGPDHTYGYDESEEEFIIPDVNTSMLPS